MTYFNFYWVSYLIVSPLTYCFEWCISDHTTNLYVHKILTGQSCSSNILFLWKRFVPLVYYSYFALLPQVASYRVLNKDFTATDSVFNYHFTAAGSEELGIQYIRILQ